MEPVTLVDCCQPSWLRIEQRGQVTLLKASKTNSGNFGGLGAGRLTIIGSVQNFHRCPAIWKQCLETKELLAQPAF